MGADPKPIWLGKHIKGCIWYHHLKSCFSSLVPSSYCEHRTWCSNNIGPIMMGNHAGMLRSGKTPQVTPRLSFTKSFCCWNKLAGCGTVATDDLPVKWGRGDAFPTLAFGSTRWATSKHLQAPQRLSPWQQPRSPLHVWKSSLPQT